MSRPPRPLYPATLLAVITVGALAAMAFLHPHRTLPKRAMHVFWFAAWTWALDLTWRESLQRAADRVALFAGAAAIAGVGELIQILMPPHQPDLIGLGWSATGVAAGVLLSLLTAR